MTRQALLKLAPVLALVALASCGASNRATNEGGTAVENATLTQLSLTSEAFQNGQPIPVQFTCDGDNRPPSLKWGEPPQGTKSFALILDDPDAPSGTFRHWGAYDIPTSVRSIGAEQPVGTMAVNDFGNRDYGGPCPPKGGGPHHYRFKLYALDVDRLAISADAKVADVEREAARHAIGRGELIGTYERK